jgi:hypothetical protein
MTTTSERNPAFDAQYEAVMASELTISFRDVEDHSWMKALADLATYATTAAESTTGVYHAPTWARRRQLAIEVVSRAWDAQCAYDAASMVPPVDEGDDAGE